MIVPNIQLWSLDVFLNSNVDFSILLSSSLNLVSILLSSSLNLVSILLSRSLISDFNSLLTSIFYIH
ncbi:hypothetical protein bpuSUM_001359 (plasmid) [Borrelia puertoricensis]|nr:hypothetical protein bpuSUM_001359 [Borrelia puertoricensis]